MFVQFAPFSVSSFHSGITCLVFPWKRDLMKWKVVFKKKSR